MNLWNPIVVASMWLLITGSPSPVALAYGDEDARREEQVEVLEHLEREARELEELIHDAKKHDNQERPTELMREHEKLVDRREQLARMIEQREDEEEEREWSREREEHERREWEERREHEEREAREQHEEHRDQRHHLEMRAFEIEVQNLELKLQKNQLEMELLRQEAAVRMAEFATNRHAMTVIAVQRIVDTAEHPEHAAELLMGLMERANDDGTRRILQMHVAQIWMSADRPERAREALSRLIASPPNRRRPRDAERRRDPEPGPQRESEVSERVRRIFAAQDKNRDEHIGFNEWIMMKEGEMTPDRLAREQALFGEIAGDDGRIAPREFLRWQQRQRPPERRDERPPERDRDRPVDRPEARR